MSIYLILMSLATASAATTLDIADRRQYHEMAARCVENMRYILFTRSRQVSIAYSSRSVASSDVATEILKELSHKYRTCLYTEPYFCSHYGLGQQTVDFIMFMNNATDFGRIIDACVNHTLPATGRPPIIIFPVGYELTNQEMKLLAKIRIKELYIMLLNDSNVEFYHAGKGIFTPLVSSCDYEDKDQFHKVRRPLVRAIRNITVGYNILPPFTFPLPIQDVKKGNPIGIDLEILIQMGFKLTYWEKQNFSFFSHDNLAGLLNALYHDDIDVVVGGFALRGQTKTFQFGYPLLNSPMVAVVRNSDTDSDLEQSILDVFQPPVIILYFAFFVGTVCVLYYQVKIPLLALIFYVFSLSLGVSVDVKRFRGNFVKVAILSMIWLSYITYAAYSTKLMASLIHRPAISSVNRLRDLCDGNYIIITSLIHDDQMPLPQCKVPAQNIMTCSNVLQCLDEVPANSSRRYAALVNKFTYDALAYKYFNKDSSEKFHVLAEVVKNEHFSYVFKRRTSYVDIVSYKKKSLEWTSILSHLISQVTHYSEKVKEQTKAKMSIRYRKPLSMTQLRTYFMMYLYGVTLASLVFICELVWHTWKLNIIDTINSILF